MDARLIYLIVFAVPYAIAIWLQPGSFTTVFTGLTPTSYTTNYHTVATYYMHMRAGVYVIVKTMKNR